MMSYAPSPRGAEIGKTGQPALLFPIFQRSNRREGTPYDDAPEPLVPWDQTEKESEARIMSYGRNRQNLLSGPRSAHFSAFKPPCGYPSIPMPPDRWSRGTKRKRNRRPGSLFTVETGKTYNAAPDLAHFSAFKPPYGYPPHPDAPVLLVPWDKTETQSKARIMSYSPFFAAPDLAHFSAFKPPLGYPPIPGAPAADCTRPNPTEGTCRVPILPRGPPRGMNHTPWGRNRQNRPNGSDLTHFSAFKPPRVTLPSRYPRTAGPVGPNRNGIGGPDHELLPKPAKPTKRPPILPIFRRSNRRAATHPSRCPRTAGPVGANGNGIGGPDYELRPLLPRGPKPAKPAKRH